MKIHEKDFLKLLQEHRNIIYKLVHLYAFNNEDKKDFYQEIVLQAWYSYPTYKGEAKFGTWLYRVCLNTIFTLKKKTNRIIYTDIVKFAENRVETASNDDKERLYKAMIRLPETERAIVSLHLDGYDNQEISSIIGISANNVGVKLHRAKQHLSTLLNIV